MDSDIKDEFETKSTSILRSSLYELIDRCSLQDLVRFIHENQLAETAIKFAARSFLQTICDQMTQEIDDIATMCINENAFPFEHTPSFNDNLKASNSVLTQNLDKCDGHNHLLPKYEMKSIDALTGLLVNNTYAPWDPSNNITSIQNTTIYNENNAKDDWSSMERQNNGAYNQTLNHYCEFVDACKQRYIYSGENIFGIANCDTFESTMNDDVLQHICLYLTFNHCYYYLRFVNKQFYRVLVHKMKLFRYVNDKPRTGTAYHPSRSILGTNTGIDGKMNINNSLTNIDFKCNHNCEYPLHIKAGSLIDYRDDLGIYRLCRVVQVRFEPALVTNNQSHSPANSSNVSNNNNNNNDANSGATNFNSIEDEIKRCQCKNETGPYINERPVGYLIETLPLHPTEKSKRTWCTIPSKLYRLAKYHSMSNRPQCIKYTNHPICSFWTSNTKVYNMLIDVQPKHLQFGLNDRQFSAYQQRERAARQRAQLQIGYNANRKKYHELDLNENTKNIFQLTSNPRWLCGYVHEPPNDNEMKTYSINKYNFKNDWFMIMIDIKPILDDLNIKFKPYYDKYKQLTQVPYFVHIDNIGEIAPFGTYTSPSEQLHAKQLFIPSKEKRNYGNNYNIYNYNHNYNNYNNNNNYNNYNNNNNGTRSNYILRHQHLPRLRLHDQHNYNPH